MIALHNDSASAKRRTKILATLGPATDDPKILARLIELDVNVVRLNFSHGTHDNHIKRIAAVRAEASKQQKVVGYSLICKGQKSGWLILLKVRFY